MNSLPVDSILSELRELLEKSSQLILSAPPGSGKTTRVPPYLLRKYPESKIALLQPRRVAVKGTYERIRHETSEHLQFEIGHQIRFESTINDKTRLHIMTEGVLAHKIRQDSQLSEYQFVIVDEFHERGLHSDFCVSWVKYLQQTTRPELKLIVMSATLNSNELAAYLESPAIVECPGQLYPLTIDFVPMPSVFAKAHDFYEKLSDVIADESERSPNDNILVFLPGLGEIKQVQGFIKNMQISHEVQCLYGRQKKHAQEKALSPQGPSRIILTTNIAETSLTVPGVRVVIDSGLERSLYFDPKAGVHHLGLQRISMASATQRSGRAARLGPGRAVRLWTESDQKRMAKHTVPELQRLDLTDYSLTLCGLKQSPYSWNWPSTPRPEATEYAMRALKYLRALGEDPKSNSLSTHGNRLFSIPTSTRNASLLVNSLGTGLECHAAFISALMDEGDFILGHISGHEFDKARCDLELRYEIFQDSSHYSSSEISHEKIRNIKRTFDAYSSLTKKMRNTSGSINHSPKDLSQLIALSYIDHLCQRRQQNGTKAKMISGRGVKISSKSCLKSKDLFIAISPTLFGERFKGEATVSWATPINSSFINSSFKDFLMDKEILDKDQKNMIGTYLEDISIGPLRPAPLSDSQKKAKAFKAFLELWKKLTKEDQELQQWFYRLCFIAKHCPQFSWPEIDNDDISPFLELPFDVLWEEEKKVPRIKAPQIIKAVELMLDESLIGFMKSEAPVKSHFKGHGSFKITYLSNAQAKIQVRPQKILGLRQHSTIALKAYKVPFELMTPANRPIQIVQNIETFWTGQWESVRKDFKGRYPKHKWPHASEFL